MKTQKQFRLNSINSIAPDPKKRLSNGPYPVPVLPWETGEGFLWGFPATVWMLLRHPITSFSTRIMAGWTRAWLFSTILVCCIFEILLLLSYFGISYNIPLIISETKNSAFSISNLIFCTISIIIGVSLSMLLNMTLMGYILYIVLRIFNDNTADINQILRLVFYSSISMLAVLAPYEFLTIQFIWFNSMIFVSIRTGLRKEIKKAAGYLVILAFCYSSVIYFIKRLPFPFIAYLF